MTQTFEKVLRTAVVPEPVPLPPPVPLPAPVPLPVPVPVGLLAAVGVPLEPAPTVSKDPGVGVNAPRSIRLEVFTPNW